MICSVIERLFPFQLFLSFMKLFCPRRVCKSHRRTTNLYKDIFKTAGYDIYSSSICTTAHCGLWPVEQCSSIFPICHQLSPSSHSQHLKISFFFLFPSFPGSSPSRPFQFLSEDFWASYPPPFSPCDLTSLSFARLSILLYFLLCSSLLVLDSSDFSIPRFHI